MGTSRCGALFIVVITAALAAQSAPARAQKIYLNPSNQDNNAVSGGGVESQYALIVANLVKPILDAAGFTARVDQDFTNAPPNANSWGADIFVSIHSNAGGGHGTETLYKSSAGQTLAGHVQTALLAQLPYQSRGLKVRNDLWVLNGTNMPACLLESVFHDCTATSGFTGHPPSESAFLRSSAGQQAIAQGIAEGVCAHYSRSCTAQPVTLGSLKGVVYQLGDLANHVAGATVTLNTGASVVYDGTAVWTFDLEPGTYTLTASAPGYAPNSIDRTVTAGATTWGSVEINRVVVPDAAVVQPPPAPTLLSPINDLTVAGTGVALSWSRVADPQGASITYDVEVHAGTVGGSPLVTLAVPDPGVTPVTATVSTTLSAGGYAWRVRARSTSGTGVWSTVASFTVGGTTASSSWSVSAAPSSQAASGPPPTKSSSFESVGNTSRATSAAPPPEDDPPAARLPGFCTCRETRGGDAGTLVLMLGALGGVLRAARRRARA